MPVDRLCRNALPAPFSHPIGALQIRVQTSVATAAFYRVMAASNLFKATGGLIAAGAAVFGGQVCQSMDEGCPEHPQRMSTHPQCVSDFAASPLAMV